MSFSCKTTSGKATLVDCSPELKAVQGIGLLSQLTVIHTPNLVDLLSLINIGIGMGLMRKITHGAHTTKPQLSVHLV